MYALDIFNIGVISKYTAYTCTKLHGGIGRLVEYFRELPVVLRELLQSLMRRKPGRYLGKLLWRQRLDDLGAVLGNLWCKLAEILIEQTRLLGAVRDAVDGLDQAPDFVCQRQGVEFLRLFRHTLEVVGEIGNAFRLALAEERALNRRRPLPDLRLLYGRTRRKPL